MENIDDTVNDLYGNNLDIQQYQLRKQLDLEIKTGTQEKAARIYGLMREIASKKSDVVSEITERYFSERGKMPEFDVLDRLSTWILRYLESLDEESLVLTDRQLRRRQNDKEVLFYKPERREFHLESDGNKLVKKAPGMDSNESHKVRVRLPHDNADKRQFNGPLRKYFQ